MAWQELYVSSYNCHTMGTPLFNIVFLCLASHQRVSTWRGRPINLKSRTSTACSRCGWGCLKFFLPSVIPPFLLPLPGRRPSIDYKILSRRGIKLQKNHPTTHRIPAVFLTNESRKHSSHFHIFKRVYLVLDHLFSIFWVTFGTIQLLNWLPY